MKIILNIVTHARITLYMRLITERNIISFVAKFAALGASLSLRVYAMPQRQIFTHLKYYITRKCRTSSLEKIVVFSQFLYLFTH